MAVGGVRLSDLYERVFFMGMTLLTTAIVSWGFAPRFFLTGIIPATVHSYLDGRCKRSGGLGRT